MILIRPLTVSDSMLTSTIAEPDSAVGEVVWTAGTYNLGERRIDIATHSVYEVVADPSTTDNPAVGAAKTPATWVRVGPTNKFKMFDSANNTATSGADVSVEIVPQSLINSVACFNVNCTDINITVYNVGGDAIYTKSIPMRSRPLVTGWYNYFYSGFSITNKFVLLDIPPTTAGKIKVEFTGAASIGTCIIGKQLQIGDAQWGTGAQLIDFSEIIEDKYGNISYTGGFAADLIDFDIMANTKDLDAIFSEFKSLRKQSAVFVGNPSNIGDSTLVYGFVRDYSQTYTWPTKSKIALTVRGLI